MARRITLYQLIRKIHFYAGVVPLVFILLFFASGYLLTKYNWFDHSGENQKSELLTYPLPTESLTSPQEISDWLQEEFSVRGQQKLIPNKDGSLRVLFRHAQQTHHFVAYPERQEFTYQKESLSAYHSIEFYHRLHDYGGGRIYDLYLLFMDIVSLALLIFAVTGLYLWLKVLKNKSLGWISLGIGLAYTGWVCWTLWI